MEPPMTDATSLAPTGRVPGTGFAVATTVRDAALRPHPARRAGAGADRQPRLPAARPHPAARLRLPRLAGGQAHPLRALARRPPPDAAGGRPPAVDRRKAPGSPTRTRGSSPPPRCCTTSATTPSPTRSRSSGRRSLPHETVGRRLIEGPELAPDPARDVGGRSGAGGGDDRPGRAARSAGGPRPARRPLRPARHGQARLPAARRPRLQRPLRRRRHRPPDRLRCAHRRRSEGWLARGSSSATKGISPLHSLINARQEMFDNVYWHHTNRACMAMLLRAVQEALLAGAVAPAELTEHDDASLLALLGAAGDARTDAPADGGAARATHPQARGRGQRPRLRALRPPRQPLLRSGGPARGRVRLADGLAARARRARAARGDPDRHPETGAVADRRLGPLRPTAGRLPPADAAGGRSSAWPTTTSSGTRSTAA